MNTIKTPNGIFFIDVEDCWIRNHMSSGKVFEHHIINDMLKPYIQKSKYIVDVGANIGCHAISYAGFNKDAKIWAFEPQEKLYNILVKNVKNNQYNDRITVYRNGLGHSNMTCNLSGLDTADRDEIRGGWNKGGLGIGKGGEEIMVTTLDSYELPGLDFIKIDVEGAEGLVIKGGEKTISKYKPVICFEHNYQRIDPSVVGLKDVSTPFEELVKLGYKRFEYLDWDNYLAFPDEINLGIYEAKKFSQFGEDGITIKLVNLIYGSDIYNKNYVEFGVESGSECNTRVLSEMLGWRGLLMDAGYENNKINLKKEFINKENIINLLEKYEVPKHINVLSVDIDFNDFYCLNEILKKYTCDIIICEYNATHLPHEDNIVIYDKDATWDETNYFGASLLSLYKLGKKYNYSLVYSTYTGVNCFFVANDIINSKKLNFKNINNVEKIYNTPKYGSGPNGGHKQDHLNRKFITFEEALKN
jgi:FkbM family methyltransferase